MKNLVSAHDHPIAGPVVIVHSMEPITNGHRRENPAHAFGPFASEAEAYAWDKASPGDDCYKTLLDLFDPYAMDGR